LNLTRTGQLWHTGHSLLFGLDFLESIAHTRFELENAPAQAIDLFHPEHGPVPAELLQGPLSYTNAHERWAGAYLQDQMSLGDHLSLLGGGRFELVRAEAGGGALHDNQLTGRAGIVWRITSDLSTYSNFTQGLGSGSGLYAFGNGYPTQGATSREWEVGLKAELREGRLGASLAWFDLTKHDLGSPVQLAPLSASPFQIGSARNKGLELDMHGEITGGLHLLASGAYIHSRIIDSDYGRLILPGLGGTLIIGGSQPGPLDKQLFGTPRLGGSFWMTYDAGVKSLDGLKLGVGAVARSERAGDNANDYTLPGFVRWNALAAYRCSLAGTPLTLQLNLDNLFNARYFESVSGTYTVMPGAPRRWLASVRAEF
jgi:iron complex outermembrane receptor protein